MNFVGYGEGVTILVDRDSYTGQVVLSVVNETAESIFLSHVGHPFIREVMPGEGRALVMSEVTVREIVKEGCHGGKVEDLEG